MALRDCLMCEPAHMICSFAGLASWQPLRSLAHCVRVELSDTMLRRAAASVIAYHASMLKSVVEPSVNDSDALVTALQLVRIEAPCHEVVGREFEKLLEVFTPWLSKMGVRDAADDSTRIHQARASLHRIDPRLWVEAFGSCPQLYAKLCRIIVKGHGSWQDRDSLVKAGAALLPCGAPMRDPQKVAAGLRLATVLSCGSTDRVAELERARVGEFANEAMYLYPDDHHIAMAALSYLNNVANCESELRGLAQLGVEPQCLAAMQRWPDRFSIQEHADYILARIRNYNGNEAEDIDAYESWTTPPISPHAAQMWPDFHCRYSHAVYQHPVYYYMTCNDLRSNFWHSNHFAWSSQPASGNHWRR